MSERVTTFRMGNLTVAIAQDETGLTGTAWTYDASEIAVRVVEEAALGALDARRHIA